MSKLPAFQFYPGDWQKDPSLRRCTHAAKGVWVDLLCLMWECEERGVLKTGGHVWTDEETALAIGGDKEVVLACIAELTLKGVSKRDAEGALTCSRMVRDENKRKLCSEAGKRGGNPLLTQTLKGGDKGVVKGQSKRNPTPSSSSSTSSSDKEARDSAFAEFWEHYPNKVAKAAVLKIWAKIPTGQLEAVLDGLAAQIDQPKWKENDGKFIPNPTTWLNQRRWEDEVKGNAPQGFPGTTGVPYL